MPCEDCDSISDENTRLERELSDLKDEIKDLQKKIDNAIDELR